MSKSRPVIVCLFLSTVLLAAATAQGATSCFEETCGGTCTPDLPVQISTLIPSSEFPGGADTPIAFADPDHGLVVALATNGQPGEERNALRFRGLVEAIYQDVGLAADEITPSSRPVKESA